MSRFAVNVLLEVDGKLGHPSTADEIISQRLSPSFACQKAVVTVRAVSSNTASRVAVQSAVSCQEHELVRRQYKLSRLH